MGMGQNGKDHHDEGSDAFFPHGFLPMPDAFRHVLSPILVKPNARGEPRPEAAAERRLLGVGCSAWFGAGHGTDTRTSSCYEPGAAQGIDSHSPYRITSSAWKRRCGGI